MSSKPDDVEETLASEPPDNLRRAVLDLGAEIDRYTDELVRRTQRPDVLLHFTDTTGLMGILQSHALWASLATAMNDASETAVAPDLVEFSGRMALARSRHWSPDFLEKVFKGEIRFEDDQRPTDYRTYVTSLCAEDVSVHWMQYAHAGTGVALEFDAHKLAGLDQFRLCKVIYETSQQIDCIRDLIAIVDKFLDHSLPSVASVVGGEWFLKHLAADLLRRYIKMLAPQMKDVAFSAEDEWRLFSSEAWVEPEKVDQPTRTTKFRTAGNRIVPYKEVPIPIESIKRIKLGYSCSLRDEEQALRVLMDECLGIQVPIIRSHIAVRP